MKYMGSKNRIAKHILPIMLRGRVENQAWVEPFVGGANLIDKVNGSCIGADINPYLIECLIQLRDGWEPPKEITREEYNAVRNDYNIRKDYTVDSGEYFPHYIGYIGFSGSYGGRFFEGGYAGITKTKAGTERNYPLEAYKNCMRQVNNIQNVQFIHSSYDELEIPSNSIIYCDPPYEGTKEYTKSKFNSKEFWAWCDSKVDDGHKVFVSEYNAPDDWECVWEKEVSSSLRSNGVISGNKKSIEKLFTK